MDELNCKLCSENFESSRSLATHLQLAHRLKTEEYTWRHVLGLSTRVSCASNGCVVPVRYVAFSFKKYCKEHSCLAESESGKIGGIVKKTWNKGQTRETDPRVDALAAKLTGEGNGFFGKHHSPETIAQIAETKRLPWSVVMKRVEESRSAKYWRLVSSEGEYDTWQDKLGFRCRVCNREQGRALIDMERGTRCHECFPVGSMAEVEIAEFVRSLGLTALQNVRDVISPYEIDVWCPEKSLGIEHHGLYWHSGGKDEIVSKDRHRKKSAQIHHQNMKLIQFFSDEWRDKRSICESMIANRLGLVKNSVGARECSIEELDVKEARSFLDAAHIDGATRSSIYFGLRDELGLVVVLSLRKPIQKRYEDCIEIARLATRPGWTCPGGAGRLLKRAVQHASKNNFRRILSYADLRFGEGKVYEKLGFSKEGETGLNYWYTDGYDRFDRFAFRAQDGMSEKEFASSRKVKQVYGAGHAIYVRNLPVSSPSASSPLHIP